MLLPILPATLKTVLAAASKLTGHKSSLPAAHHALVECRAGAVTITATDLDLWLTYRARQPDGAGGSDGAALIPLETLRKAQAAADKDTCVLLRDGCVDLTVGGNAIQMNFRRVDVADFPPATPIAGLPQRLTDWAKESILAAFDCCSQDETRHILQGAYLDVETRECQSIAATDGKHLIISNSMQFPALRKSFILPQSKVLREKPLAAEPWSVRFQEGQPYMRPPFGHEIDEYKGRWKDACRSTERWGWIPPKYNPPTGIEDTGDDHFQVIAGPWTVTGRPIGGNYPNYRQVIPETHRIEASIPEAAVAGIQHALATLPGSEKYPETITVQFSPETGITFRIADAVIPVPGSTADGAMRCAFSRVFWQKALRMGLLTILASDPISPIVFFTKGRRMVAMPMRLQ